MAAPVLDAAQRTGGAGTSGRILRRNWFASVIFFAVGGALLGSSLFLGWYVVGLSTSGGPTCPGISEVLYPGWVAVTTSGPNCPASSVGSYQSQKLTTTGQLYLAVTVLTIAGAALAGFAGLLVGLHFGQRRPKLVLALAAAAMVIGVLGPALIATIQSNTICSDQGFVSTPFASPAGAPPPPNSTVGNTRPACNAWTFYTSSGGGWTWSSSSGPWNSFVGSDSLPGASATWGPGLGWYFAIVSTVCVASGAYLSRRFAPE